MAPKNTPKRSNNGPIGWVVCETCEIALSTRDKDVHSEHCPALESQLCYSFVKDNCLYSLPNMKTNEEIKNVSLEECDNMVFLSQSAIQLCQLSIGESAIIEDVASKKYFSCTVWPTFEKSIGSVLFTKNAFDLLQLNTNSQVRVKKVTTDFPDAKTVKIIVLNPPKGLEISKVLLKRLRKNYKGRLVMEGNLVTILFFGKYLKFQVKEVTRCNKSIEEEFENLKLDKEQLSFVKITENSSLEIYMSENDYKSSINLSSDPFSEIGGLHKEKTELKDLISFALGLKRSMSGFKCSRSALLYGNSGTGKTLLAKALLHSIKAHSIHMNAPDLYTKNSTGPEENIKKLFKDAKRFSPSIILLDEIDILCPTRNSRLTETEKRVISTILTEIDDVTDNNLNIFILATTSKLDNVDSSLRRSGRLEREMEIPVPDPIARLDILKILCKNSESSIDENLLKQIAYSTHGYVGADLNELCSYSSFHASQNNKSQITEDDFKYALSRVKPSAMREVLIEVPNVLWSDIGGQDKLKLILKQCVEWPLKHADSFIRLGITPPRGVLMYGPPGCSKTMIAKALATQSGLNFLSIKGPELFSKWVGESERAVREVFGKARQVAPSIIFFDEIDALGGERTVGPSASNVQERVLAQLLTELDGVSPLGNVTILAATNRPDKIDKALLRPGRLDRIVYVPLPDCKTREDIFRIKMTKMPVKDVDLDVLVSKTEGYSGAEVNALCHEAAMMALEENLDAVVIDNDHFLKALDLITPRTPKSLLKIYEEYNERCK